MSEYTCADPLPQQPGSMKSSPRSRLSELLGAPALGLRQALAEGTDLADLLLAEGLEGVDHRQGLRVAAEVGVEDDGAFSGVEQQALQRIAVREALHTSSMIRAWAASISSVSPG